MSIVCPAKSHPDWKSLVNKVGEDEAYFLWNNYDGKVPLEVANNRRKSITELRKEIGIPYQINESNKPNILKKISNYNTKNQTSHSVNFDRIGQSQRLKVNLIVDFTPYSQQAREERAKMRSEEGKVFTEPIQETKQVNKEQQEANLQEYNKVKKAETMEEVKAQMLKDFDSYYPQFKDLLSWEKEMFIDMMSEGEINTYC